MKMTFVYQRLIELKKMRKVDYLIALWIATRRKKQHMMTLSTTYVNTVSLSRILEQVIVGPVQPWSI
ncbi:unnamed protein product [Haemonchus placei]|uniref:Transcriptional regulator n=1 Tax=Haemonchus placei TaxID=6290 RepID=A0A0N4WHU7_HAEPC|nr:unnamed protein product [Haemonchus placei]